jgi:hypothetical protein
MIRLYNDWIWKARRDHILALMSFGRYVVLYSNRGADCCLTTPDAMARIVVILNEVIDGHMIE